MVIPCAVVVLPRAGEQCSRRAVDWAGLWGLQLLPLPYPSCPEPCSHHCCWPGSSATGSSPTAGNHSGFITGTGAAARQEKTSALLSPQQGMPAGRDVSCTQGGHCSPPDIFGTCCGISLGKAKLMERRPWEKSCLCFVLQVEAKMGQMTQASCLSSDA